MLNDLNLSVSDSQQLAEALIQHLVDEAGSLDPLALADVLQSGLAEDDVQDLVSVLLGISVSELQDWIDDQLEEPDWDPEY